MKYFIGIVALLVLALGITHLLPTNQSTETDGPIAIATSFYPLEYALTEITGDLGTVTNIGAGRDPHDFVPTTEDILALQKADLVVLQGADFEPWGHDVEEGLEDAGVKVVIATAELELMEGGHHHEHEEDEHEEEHSDEHEEDEPEEEHEHEEDEHDHGEFDPHTWLDPILFIQTVEQLTEALIAIDPNNSEAYESNSAELIEKLQALDISYQNRLASCTLDEVITSHDAFGYVSARYNFAVHSIGGLSTQDTPSVATLAELREEAEEGISTILLEENSIAAYGETLARETGLTTASINPIAYVVPEGEDYLSLMQKNLDTFATALNCNE
tara:strand:+ start:6515 stop:7507 length:993 start_codon:yes stop_codon:yes gene_type:complete